MSAAPFRPELLLSHADFVRRLAQRLVRDPSLADDVAQAVAFDALHRPPRDAGRLRGWLAASARSIARNLWRAERREAARGAAYLASRAPAPSPQEVLAREELRQRVVHAVLALEDPFRATLLLRFYDDLSPRAIAARMGVPPATVRSRLKRALDQVRADLGADGDPRAGALLLLCPGRPVGLALWCVMNTKVTVISAVGAAALLFAWWAGSMMRDAPAPPVEAGSVVASVAGSSPPGGDSPPQRAVIGSGAVGVGRAGSPVLPAVRPLGRLEGIVLDLAHARVEGASVELRPWIGVMPPDRRIDDDRGREFRTRTDAAGAFTFIDVPEGPYTVIAAARDLVARELTAVGSGATDPTILLLEEPVTLGDDISFRVIDESREPVADAELTVCGISAREGPIGLDAGDPLRGRSDEEGRWRLRDHSMRHGVVLAMTAAGKSGLAQFGYACDPMSVEVRVGNPGRVHGRLVGVPAEHLQGVHLDVRLLGADGPGISMPVEGPTFTFSAPAGEHVLALRGPSSLRLVTNAEQERRREGLMGGPTVVLTGGATAAVSLELTRAAVVQGTVLTSGAPVSGANVCVRPATAEEIKLGATHRRASEPWTDWMVSPHFVARTTTDHAGRYGARGLSPGSHVVEVAAPGLSADVRIIDLEVDHAVDLTHDLQRAGALQLAGCRGTLGVMRRGQSRPLYVIDAYDCLTLPGLAPGSYVLLHKPQLRERAFQALTEFTIEVGRTTWLDLRPISRQASIRGVVRAGALGVPGVVISQRDQRTLTDADGNYVLWHNEAGAIWSGQWHTPLRIHDGGLQHAVWLPDDRQGDATATVDVHLGEHSLVVEATDTDGHSCTAELWFEAVAPALAKGHVHRVSGTIRLDGTGRRRVRWLPAAKASLRATFPSGFEDRLAVDVPGTASVRLCDRPCGTIRVRVVKHGKPVAECGVLARTWRGSGPAPPGDGEFTDAWYREAGADDEGRAVLRGVAAGAVWFQVADPQQPPPFRVLRFTVEAGETKEIEVDLAR